MSNVKPGDIAVFVESTTPPEFRGRQCVVLKPDSSDFLERQYPGQAIWRVEMLQSVWVKEAQKYMNVKPVHPAGSLARAVDGYLRRIEPPGDVEELYASKLKERQV